LLLSSLNLCRNLANPLNAYLGWHDIIVAMDQMKDLELCVAISRPVRNQADRLSNYYHWAFHVFNKVTGTHKLFETAGEQNQLDTQENDAPPERVVKSIIVGYSPSDSLPTIRDAIRTVEVQNDVFSWDCQDYVIEIMDALEEASLLGDMPKYDQVKAAIKRMRGSMDESYQSIPGNGGGDEEDELANNSSEEDEDGVLDDVEEDEDEPPNVRSAELVVDSDEDEEEEDNAHVVRSLEVILDSGDESDEG
jgi:hypothetical protein